jgi:hypothetical protein
MPNEPNWTEVELGTWADFLRLATGVLEPARHQPSFLFRGQPEGGMRLISSLARSLPPGLSDREALRAERAALDEFLARAHFLGAASTILNAARIPALTDYWAQMQHYGAPTRLIDWTASPYVAAYFASIEGDDSDGAIFVVEPEPVREDFEQSRGSRTEVGDEDLIDPDAPSALLFFRPRLLTERLILQQGHFSLNLNVLADHEQPLERARTRPGPARRRFEKWILPRDAKPVFLHQLRAMNVAANTLFPGLDGVGRSIAEFIRTSEWHGD